MTDVSLVAVSFVLMEGFTYLAHRFVMHGAGMVLHRSHHASSARGGERFELNDLYPMFFASVTIMAMAAGAALPALHPVLVVGIGVTAYGMAYMFVHDVYIHRRLRWFTMRIGVCERLKQAHAVHHLFGGEPYGMLFPVVPVSLRKRAASRPDPFGREAASA